MEKAKRQTKKQLDRTYHEGSMEAAPRTLTVWKKETQEQKKEVQNTRQKR